MFVTPEPAGKHCTRNELGETLARNEVCAQNGQREYRSQISMSCNDLTSQGFNSQELSWQIMIHGTDG